MSDAVITGAVVTLGACVGSFLNVVIYRLPRGSFLSLGSRSVCPACRQRIPWFDNLPVLSWLLLRGRARCCQARISVRYIAVEILTALLFLLLFVRGPHAPVIEGDQLSLVALGGFVFQAVFLALLVANTFIDLEHRILPDVLTKPGMVIGCLGGAVVPGLAGMLDAPGLPPAMASLLYSGLGLAAGVGLTLAIRIAAHAVFKKEAMGLGDVKFMGMIGAFLGFEGAVLTFFVGCLVGAVGGVVHRWLTGDPYVPFGPFLAIGAVMVLFLRQPIMEFLFTTWPEWIERSQSAPWVLSISTVLCIVLLVVLVRRGRAS